MLLIVFIVHRGMGLGNDHEFHSLMVRFHFEDRKLTRWRAGTLNTTSTSKNREQVETWMLDDARTGG
jgi:hypothetical protein